MAKKSPDKRQKRRVHTAAAVLSVPSLTKAGSSLWLYIYAGGEAMGKLEIGRGGLKWTGRHRKAFVKMSWSNFAAKLNKLYAA